MRAILIFIGIFLSINGSTQESGLAQANTALKNKEYSKALELYQKIESNNKGGAGLYQNMGLAAAGLHQDAIAILYFEKALKFEPNNTAVRHDIGIIRNRNTLLDSEAPVLYPVKIWNTISGVFLPHTWTLLNLSSLFILVVLLVFYYPFTEFSKKEWRTLGIFTFIFFFTLIAAYHRNEQVFHNSGYIITENESILKTGPDQASPDVMELPAGTKVYKKDQLDDWYQVLTTYGNIGWIPSKIAKRI